MDTLASRIDTVPHRVINREKIPAKRYYDEAFFKLEQERLWPHVWQMACRLEEIPEVGDYVEYKNLDKSVIVVRTKSGVRAFHNACRHRGVQLVMGAGNCGVQGFICPFHGWRWNSEGENTFVYGRQSGIFSPDILNQAEINLASCRLETWAGCAFINFDDTAAPLLEGLGSAAERMNVRNADQLKMEWWYATVLPTNWKLAMEGFMEGYHVMRTHPQLNDRAPYNPYGMDVGAAPSRQRSGKESVAQMVDFLKRLSTGMSGMVHSSEVAIAESLQDMDVPDDVGGALGAFTVRLKDEITKQGRARGLPMPDINEVDTNTPHKQVEYIFPHFFLLPFFGSMSSYRIRPLTPETCFFEIWSLTFMPEDQPRDRPRAPTILPYNSSEFPEIPQQDYSNLPRQQLGIHAGGFEELRLAQGVEGLISNYERLIDGYLARLSPEALLNATKVVNSSGYEAAVMELGF